MEGQYQNILSKLFVEKRKRSTYMTRNQSTNVPAHQNNWAILTVTLLLKHTHHSRIWRVTKLMCVCVCVYVCMCVFVHMCVCVYVWCVCIYSRMWSNKSVCV